MGINFSATSIEKCLEKAASQLDIDKDSIKYKVIKEERRLFKKVVEIEIIEYEDKDIIKAEKNEIKDYDRQEVVKKTLDAGAKIKDGKIIVTNFPDNKDIITIKPCDGVILLVNGQQCKDITPVTEQDKIEYKFEEEIAIRDINISITLDKMEAYITTKCIPQKIYKLEDQEYCKNLFLNKVKVSEKYPTNYKVSELEEILKSKGIRYGIIIEELQNICNEHNITNKLIAKGKMPKDDIPDEIKLRFKDSNELINYDSDKKVDYRNRYFIANVKSGDIIAEQIPGREGEDGLNILGKKIKRKIAKKIIIKAGEGCKIEGNKVIVTSEGKPSYRGNTFAVNKLYRTEEVNLESGNIDFVGDVEVVGNVNEGMKIVAGNEVFVGKNVESANIRANGQVNINGNVLKSTIRAGNENIGVVQYLDDLQIYKVSIDNLISSVEQIKATNLLGVRSDGEIIKILMENKFKSIDKVSKKILEYNSSQRIKDTPLINFINNKIIGFGPIRIKKIGELYGFLEKIDKEIKDMDDSIIVPADVYFDYCQGSQIEASGSIIVTGKGQYISNITALKNIEFISDRAVCRGGELSAGEEIRVKTVGSIAGISTKLRVPKEGRIIADIAYNNTVFCFGEKQILLEVSAKNVEAYMDKTGEIVIDKFIL